MRGRALFFWRLQDGRCYLRMSEGCKNAHGKLASYGKSDRRRTWDHVMPRAKGGGGAFNILLCCRECNALKSAALPSYQHQVFAQRLGMAWHRYENMKEKHRARFLSDWLADPANIALLDALRDGGFISNFAPPAPALTHSRGFG